MNEQAQPLAITRANTQAEYDFELLQRKAKILTTATMVSPEIRDSIGNCVIIQEIAQSMGAVPWQVASSIYFVNGKPSFKASYLIARLNQSGILRGRLKYNVVGEKGTDSYGMYASGIDAQTEDELIGPTITIALAKEEGWYNRTGSKWKTLPEKMLHNRSASFWISTHAPEIMMGMTVTEEMIDIKDINEPRKQNESIYFKNDQADEVLIDSVTGEVLDSPAFIELKKQLMETKTIKEVDKFASHPLTKKMGTSERTQFIEMIGKKCRELRNTQA